MNFSLAAILSVTTGTLLCDFGEMAALFNHITQDSVFTHQLVRLAEPVKTELLKQHPQLSDIDTAGVGRANWEEFLAVQVGKFGLALWVDPLSVYEHRDPVEEAIEIWGEDKVLVVPTDYPMPETTEGENHDRA